MNKSIISSFFVLLIICCSLTSCGKGETPSADYQQNGESSDSYVFETDWQYYMCNNTVHMPKIQETENGCVFVHKGFIYRYEQGGAIMPLCSRANCLHDLETDPGKLSSCHAYLDNIRQGDAVDVTLMKYKDELYIVYERGDHDPEKGDYCLLKMALDGSSKDILKRVQSMTYPLIHRGYLYYFPLDFSVQKTESEDENSEGILAEISLHRINITDKKLKDELVYYQEGDHGNSGLVVYGNKLWFMMIGNQGTRLTSFVLDLETGKTEEAEAFLQVYRDRYYMRPYDLTKGDRDMTSIVRTDMYGKTEETVIPEVEQLSTMMSDGNYFYITNTQIHLAHPEVEEKCRVYDENFQLVDEYKLPDVGYPYGPAIGGDAYQYIRYTDEESGDWGLLIFDKSRIGSIHGEYCPYSFVKYGAEGTDPEPFVPTNDPTGPSEEIQVPDTTLNQEVSLTYTEPEEEIVTGKLQKNSLDHISGNYTDCQVFLSADKVRAVVTPVTPATQDDPRNDDIEIGRCFTRTTTLYGYYTKGKETYVRKTTMTGINAEEPATAEMELPEDGDEFIGVKAVTEGDYQKEYWSPPEEGVYNPGASRTTVQSFREILECYEGRVEE